MNSHIVERWTGRMLRLGIWVSSLLMISGMVAAWLQPEKAVIPASSPGLAEVWRMIVADPLHPVSLMTAGIVCLMLTPFLRVFTALVGFISERDRRFTLVSFIVFAMLIGELIFSMR